jgi:hypothetical protein
MLYLATVEPHTLELLKTLQAIPEVANYRLVGGTALALRFGHRKSIDLDLFCHKTFDSNLIRHTLAQHKLKLIKANSSNVFFRGYINKVKVDFVKDFDGWLKKEEMVDGVRLARLDDLAAMKLGAISGHGRKKDFVDLYYLLGKFSVSELLSLFSKRAKMKDTFHILLSMTYFNDAEKDEMPYLFDNDLTWKKIKKKISAKVLEYSKPKI